MIKLSVMYPATDGARFDFDYYCNKHIPMVLALLGEACKGATVDEGLCGANPLLPATHVAVAGLLFASPPEFEAAFGPVAAQVMADLPNFTDIQPVVQISQVRLQHAA